MIYWLSTGVSTVSFSTNCKAAASAILWCFLAFVEAVQTVVAVLADLVADDGLLVSPTHLNSYDVIVMCLYFIGCML